MMKVENYKFLVFYVKVGVIMRMRVSLLCKISHYNFGHYSIFLNSHNQSTHLAKPNSGMLAYKSERVCKLGLKWKSFIALGPDLCCQVDKLLHLKVTDVMVLCNFLFLRICLKRKIKFLSFTEYFLG